MNAPSPLPHKQLRDGKLDLSAIAASIRSPYDQLKLIRLLAEEFSWSDAWGSINAGCDQIDAELLQDNAEANGHATRPVLVLDYTKGVRV